MKKSKVTYILSNINKAIAFEWIALNLSKEKFDISFLLLNPGSSELETFLIQNNVPVKRIKLVGKQSYVSVLLGALLYLLQHKPQVIHCHMFDATLIGLTAGKLLGIKKRIYTRHHCTYNWEYNPKGIKYDRLINQLATKIVAISKNVYNILTSKENVNPSKITLIHHGFELGAFKILKENTINSIQKKYNQEDQSPVIGIIARWFQLKGIQYIIPAFKKLLIDYPEALLVLANANGPYKKEIEEALSELPENSYCIIPFENDLFALYQLFDVYVHTPINQSIEAFGQTYIEALASSIPSVFTLSGVAPEFIEHEQNALVVPFENSNAIYDAIKRLLEDESLRQKLIVNGKESVQKFSLDSMIKKLECLYLA